MAQLFEVQHVFPIIRIFIRNIDTPPSIQKGEAGSITEFLYFLLHNNMKFNMCVVM